MCMQGVVRTQKFLAHPSRMGSKVQACKNARAWLPVEQVTRPLLTASGARDSTCVLTCMSWSWFAIFSILQQKKTPAHLMSGTTGFEGARDLRSRLVSVCQDHACQLQGAGENTLPAHSRA